MAVLENDPPDDKNDESNENNSGGNSRESAGGRWDTHIDRSSERDFYKKENVCHLNGTGDNFLSDLKDRATSKENGFKLLFKDSNLKLSDHKQTAKELNLNINTEHENASKRLGVADRTMVWACEQIEKMQKQLPDSNLKDFVNGSCKMVENYAEMKMWNHKEVNWDKLFHCMGNCEAAEFGKGGYEAAKIISNIRETIFNDSDSENDQTANRLGRDNAERCYSTCSSYIPDNYRKNLKLP